MAWIEQLVDDLRVGCRTLRKHPGFTAVAVLTLALGIGINSAMYSVVHGVLIAPLRYGEPDRLVVVWENNPRFTRVYVSYLNFLDWQRESRSFVQMAAFRERGTDLTSPGTPEHLRANEITRGFFGTLGNPLTLGREFSTEEDRPGGAPVAILSDRLWRDRFQGDPHILGRPVVLDGVVYSIVGIAPREFRLEGNADVYTPLGNGDPLVLNDRGGHDGIFALARLAPGVTIAQAQADVSAIQNHLDQLYPEANRDLGIYVQPLKEEVVGDVAGVLLLLLGAVGLVLLIACANVTNLLLARLAARKREFAVRAALGANRGRLIRQVLTESLLVSLAGAVLGVLAARLAVRGMLMAFPAVLPRSEDVRVNPAVLAFTLGVSVAAALAFGVVPALKSSNADPQGALRAGGRGSTGVHHRTQSLLVIAQMALTLVLLSGAGLLLQTVRHLWRVSPGFDPQHVVSFKVGVSHSLMKSAAAARTSYQELIERIRAIPGVESADYTVIVPLSGQAGTMPFWINSEKPESLQGAPRVVMSLTGPDYLRTMGIPLRQGRFFTKNDTTESPCVIVIDEVLAHNFFSRGDAVGQTLSAGFSPVGPCRIVGVAGHVKYWGLDDANSFTQNQAYFPLYQDPDRWVVTNYPDATIVLRTPLPLSGVMPEIAAAAAGVGGDQPVFDVRSMQEIVSESMSSRRFPLLLLGVFAGLALLLASVGLYGVVSYAATQRTQEIGIRVALGARKESILALIVGHGLRMVLGGLAIGCVAAVILARLLKSFSPLLYGVNANDPTIFFILSVVLTAVGLLACYLPARRASRVDPMIALRYE